MSPRQALVSLLATVGMGLPSAAMAATITVGQSSQADYTDVDSALAAAAPGEDLTVILEAGKFTTAHINRAGQTRLIMMEVGDAILQGIRVSNPDAQVSVTRIDVGADGIEVSQGDLVLESVAIEPTPVGAIGGPALQVGTGATVRASHVVVSHWSGAEAPVVLQPGSTADLQTFGIFASSGSRAGAIWSQDATLAATTVYAIDTNSTSGTGGLELDGGTAMLADCDFDTVRGALAGGIRVLNDATLTGYDLVFMDNSAPAGAAIRLESGDIRLVRTFARGGSADDGGVLWMEDGTADVRNADWSNNRATKSGGTIYQSGGSLDVAYATWTEAVATQGAGVYSRGGNATLTGVLLTHTEGSAIKVESTGAVDFSAGLLWRIGSDTTIEGAVNYAVNEVYRDPAFVNIQLDEFALTIDSPALDLGIDGQLDPDGTASDAGMYGGPDAWSLADSDGDGFVYGRDCDDTRDDVHEGAVDVFYDGIDANCDGGSDFDQDGDGFDAASFSGGDCDDTDASVNPDASESGGDGIDANCDGFDHADEDGDGWPADLDCDDSASGVHPGAEDLWYDGVDADCAGNDDFDQDGDGHRAEAAGGDDCDDTNARQHPGYPDTPGDGIDQDCDGRDPQKQPEYEDEVTTLSPAPSESETPSAGSPELSAQSAGGCSTIDSSESGAWSLLLIGLVGLVGRRR